MNDRDEIRWFITTFGIFGITAEDLELMLER